ncbi:MAG: Elongation factor 4 [Candidatus Wolfebacteria bacterium GW2011_GWC2_46_275]|uniref:Elongation factor 4 n=2 Tax=Candidatus Wolfeibacteriota TaxID=1752735 RepID=A0A0G1U6Y9_9BACT|nr:MAG: GTP-binding protein LepA, GTP-binding protein LepA [Candidatus Wolfebacteria bacterium GW2011_GWB1_47_1]KKU35043.1 MAG: Elongation factor 4 [Candidatus Wolfebacteria bacterium GW2011_GWC2_46_275]KKU41277.1 MAG: Elongation factor 4 [Candidatus Wolfebacteria bacterium GW2011_GWB2_46_69]KKU53640.1 MAG: Elongation factor 4 [Candidatus Wolfebacteria bacterium GW2011_GWC1_47_103]KKU59393.1 MAG: Elongation factor 4 [Candidatus Wolfebacteria bacterium GW2011_GWE2_47_12]KKU65571.1 MAG: Elongati
MGTEHIRNFAIIAHIDHGKSTLADRLLEITKTVEAREMKAQFLDQMDLERERGITIKMAPVRMEYTSQKDGKRYILNLIDTPGHPDFAYEVSRAFKAVEGVILLVDATQGIQAQTLANFEMAKRAGVKVIGALNKVDMNPAQLDTVLLETASLLDCPLDDIFRISGKTGFGVQDLLEAVIEKLPPPKEWEEGSKEQRAESNAGRAALVFDSVYDDHKGIIAFVRVFRGEFAGNQDTKLVATNVKIKTKEVGFFQPKMKASAKVSKGEIGYIATGIKDPDKLKIGDTIGDADLGGYQEPQPRVFVSFFPEDGSEYEEMKKAFQKLKLTDPALKTDPDYNDVLGRGFKVGFLGKLHFEIISQRLEQDFDMDTVNSFPSVAYKIKKPHAKELTVVENPQDLPAEYDEIWEPMIELEILAPTVYLGPIMKLKEPFRMGEMQTTNMVDRVLIRTRMPLMELISDFDDQLKSLTHGYASFSYEMAEYQKADLARIDVMVAKDMVVGLSRILPKKDIEYEARQMAVRLKDLLPQQQFAQAIQITTGAKVIARETIAPMRKDVTGYLYGGDRTRKMKLWKKQKEGKKRLLSMAKVNVSADVFKELLKK